MLRGIKAVLLASAGLGMLVMPSAHAGTQSQDYVIGQGDYISVCEGADVADTGVESPANIGGVCFGWGGGKSEVEVTIADLVNGDKVGFYYQWYNAAGEFLLGDNTDPVTGEPVAMAGTSCSPDALPIPSGGRGMKIWLDQAFGPLDCSPDAGIATTGTVTIDVT